MIHIEVSKVTLRGLLERDPGRFKELRVSIQKLYTTEGFLLFVYFWPSKESKIDHSWSIPLPRCKNRVRGSSPGYVLSWLCDLVLYLSSSVSVSEMGLISMFLAIYCR